MDELELKEYDMLKEEINQKINLDNTLLTFTITTSVAVISLAFGTKIPIIHLITFCILIPMSMRIAYYRQAMSKLSAYIIVFIEDNCELKWETRNAKIMELIKEDKNVRKKYWGMKCYDCLILSVVACLSYSYTFVKSMYQSDDFGFALIFLSFILVFVEACITVKSNRVDEEKQVWKERWTILKNQEIVDDVAESK